MITCRFLTQCSVGFYRRSHNTLNSMFKSNTKIFLNILQYCIFVFYCTFTALLFLILKTCIFEVIFYFNMFNSFIFAKPNSLTGLRPITNVYGFTLQQDDLLLPKDDLSNSLSRCYLQLEIINAFDTKFGPHNLKLLFQVLCCLVETGLKCLFAKLYRQR